MTRIRFVTFGCSLNMADTETMKGLLQEAGYTITLSEDDADLYIVNTCMVKKATETKVMARITELALRGRPLVVAGCIPQVRPSNLAGISIIGPHQLGNIVEVVEETLHGNAVALVVQENNPRLGLAKKRTSPVIEILPISKGCLGSPCTYCIVKSARGELVSYPKEEILAQARRAISEGVREIWVSAQDTGCYGADIGESLPALLKDILAIPGNFMVRLGMANPDHVAPYLDELIEAFLDRKMFKFLHLPVQSGNDDILNLMKRGYTIAAFEDTISRFRAAIPQLTVSTDIICGFPTETNEQFMDSVNLIRRLKPDVLNISRFSAHAGTEAAGMEQTPGAEIKRRSTFLADVKRKITTLANERWLGWEGMVIVDERGKGGTMVARNFCYKPVVLKEDVTLGALVRVRINHSTEHDLRGTIIPCSGETVPLPQE